MLNLSLLLDHFLHTLSLLVPHILQIVYLDGQISLFLPQIVYDLVLFLKQANNLLDVEAL